MGVTLTSKLSVFPEDYMSFRILPAMENITRMAFCYSKQRDLINSLDVTGLVPRMGPYFIICVLNTCQ